MEQLLLHLFGDYIAQTNWMATNKTKYTWPAFLHATIYSLPFLLIGGWNAVFVIWITHFIIDRFYLARYLCFAKNWITQPSLKWANCSQTGYPKEAPEWLTVWLMIAADNTLHLFINYFALKWL